MNIRTAEQWAEQLRRMETWRRWFAWRPVRLVNNDTVWLETVERRLSGGKAKFDEDGLIRVWEYRREAA